MDINDLVVRRTLRVPVPEGPSGDAAAVVRQFDAVLMSAGFKLSSELFSILSQRDSGFVMDIAVGTLGAVRRMVGDHVEHNVYFRDFPRGVPDTVEFWTECLLEALADPEAAAQVAADARIGTLNLLSLPKYGRYQHDYLEMLDHHERFVEDAADRVTVLRAGGDPSSEAGELYGALAAATIPGNDDDRAALTALAEFCAFDHVQPQDIPIRENRALINRVRVDLGAPLLVDTVTDVLRLACAISDGDVTLASPTRFGGFPRRARRTLLTALNGVVEANPAALGDVNRYAERWKRLGERLHPHEFALPHAADVFAVARGQKSAPSLAARVEDLLTRDDVPGATRLLRNAPGQLFRSADRLLRSANERDLPTVTAEIGAVAGQVSGRVLLSLREHLENREAPGKRRVFINQSARGHIAPDQREPIPGAILTELREILDAELRTRLGDRRWVVAPDVLDIALPISGKAIADGFGTLPRGSRLPIAGNLLRFFVYWREARQTTDFDLSALMLDADFGNPEWLSYTNLTAVGGSHSGDVIEAPEGASEFIDLDLSKVPCDIVIPQVNIFSGEGFGQVAESFFGYMLRTAEQEGAPFEPRTVRMKSGLRGRGRVALPMVFVRTGNEWVALSTHLHLTGEQDGNQVEDNHISTSDLVGSILRRKYLTIRYLAELTGARIGAPDPAGGPVTYVGMEVPQELPDGSTVITPGYLGEIVPA
ncbi:TerD family protein [Nocardia macrotermitis]|uniref:TerD domain-containing protein n=1 Tax=Nocardia macrotermitis TaxID=2585198 RepID=A0A7K0D255_9NOCA|nr:TerD family protein [Nocardia macrotermitis]MQY19816.1 hypothetical protein [Nocardia macrotermitis]